MHNVFESHSKQIQNGYKNLSGFLFFSSIKKIFVQKFPPKVSGRLLLNFFTPTETAISVFHLMKWLYKKSQTSTKLYTTFWVDFVVQKKVLHTCMLDEKNPISNIRVSF